MNDPWSCSVRPDSPKMDRDSPRQFLAAFPQGDHQACIKKKEASVKSDDGSEEDENLQIQDLVTRLERVEIKEVNLDSKRGKNGVDHATWLKKKLKQKQEEKAAKERKAAQAAVDETTSLQLETSQESVDSRAAWERWRAEKERELQRKQQSELQKVRMMQIEEEKKRRDAKRTYAQWYQTKEQERKSKSNKDEGKSERLAEMKKEAGERRKKLGYNLEWREWCRLKKQQSLPKRFTYHEYPEPTWTNPDPWVD